MAPSSSWPLPTTGARPAALALSIISMHKPGLDGNPSRRSPGGIAFTSFASTLGALVRAAHRHIAAAIAAESDGTALLHVLKVETGPSVMPEI